MRFERTPCKCVAGYCCISNKRPDDAVLPKLNTYGERAAIAMKKVRANASLVIVAFQDKRAFDAILPFINPESPGYQ
jgi:hypothetical protein